MNGKFGCYNMALLFSAATVSDEPCVFNYLCGTQATANVHVCCNKACLMQTMPCLFHVLVLGRVQTYCAAVSRQESVALMPVCVWQSLCFSKCDSMHFWGVALLVANH